MTQQVPITPSVEEQTPPACRHYWVIQPATGPTSPGRCQTCGETRDFKNYVEASTWGDEKGSHRSASETVTAPTERVEDAEEEE